MIFAFDFHGVTLPWVENDKDIDSELFAKMIMYKTGRSLEEVKYYLYGAIYPGREAVTKDYEDFVAERSSPIEFLSSVLAELHGEHYLTEDTYEKVKVQANELLEEYLRRTRINWEVMKIIKRLADNNQHVGYLTNRTGLSMRLLSEMVPDYIDYFPLGGISSHSVVYEKPHTRIYELFYEYVCNKLSVKVNPDEIVLIDDMPENIYSAEKMGWNGIVFENSKQLESVIKERFVESL